MYKRQIQVSDVFPQVLEYHNDGPNFWRSRGVHHPFLLPHYTGDGRRYHRTFAKIGFQPKHADCISFVELLDYPTAGRNQLSTHDLKLSHLQWIRNVVFGSDAKFIFLSAGVQRLLLKTELFGELRDIKRDFRDLKVIF